MSAGLYWNRDEPLTDFISSFHVLTSLSLSGEKFQHTRTHWVLVKKYLLTHTLKHTSLSQTSLLEL